MHPLRPIHDEFNYQNQLIVLLIPSGKKSKRRCGICSKPSGSCPGNGHRALRTATELEKQTYLLKINL